jgi:hypothetical protein
MALQYDPINQSQVLTPDYAPTRYPERAVSHVELAAAPPPVMPPEAVNTIVSAPAPADVVQESNPAPPTTEAYSNWPAPAPPPPPEPVPATLPADYWMGSNINEVV